MKKYLAIDINKTKLKYAIIDEKLDISKQGNAYITTKSKEDLFLVYRNVVEENRSEIEGVTISLPGVIDMNTGYAYSGGVFSWVNHFPYAQELSEYLNIPVVLCNDAKAAALAEIGYGSLKRINNGVLLMLLSTGIGGAVIVDGHLLNGNSFAAGEFSYLNGNYQKNNPENLFYKICSTDQLTNLVSQECGKEINILQVMAGLSRKEEKVIAGVKKFCDALAMFIYNIQCVVDAQRFVIGGSISNEPIIMKMIQESVAEAFAKAPYQRIYLPEIVPAVFKENAKMYGAVYHYRKLKEEI